MEGPNEIEKTRFRLSWGGPELPGRHRLAADKDKIDIGKPEYEQKCTICHGALGKGDGAYSEMLTKRATDLTVLSKKNGGVFPFARVFEIIEGTHELKAHGTRDMPIWGKEYRSSKYYDYYLHDPEMDRSYFARSRILALTEYIYRLQAK